MALVEKMSEESACSEEVFAKLLQGVPQAIYFENGQEKKRILFTGNFEKDVRKLTEIV